MEVGDKFSIKLPKPMTWLDRALWRLFRYERKRPEVQQRFVIIHTDTPPKL